MKILVLEDNERLAKLIKDVLEKEGFQVDWFIDGEEALNVISNGYHCFILDINVPSIDGLSILETIRLYNKEIPVIIISSSHELEKIQTSYELGCDDFLKKPFYVYELVQKVKKSVQKSKDCIDLWSGYRFDIGSSRLFCKNDQEIKLTKKEILFLELFIQDTKRVVRYGELEEYVWEGEATSLENMRALVKRLRKKLPKGAIVAVKELGYALGQI